MSKIFSSLLISLFLVCTAYAENSQDFGDYVVHYNAFPSTSIPASVAKNYNIVRSKERAVINISVLKKVMGTSGTPVDAKVTGTAKNLMGQQQSIHFKEIKEETAIYYIAQMQVEHREVLNFTLNVRIPGESSAVVVKFKKQFYTN